MNTSTTWSLLVLTLPTQNATARMRFWRALKARGCAVLRDGIYLLPYTEERERVLRELSVAIAESGGTAHLLRASSLDTSQEAEFCALFDRADEYDGLIRALADARKTISGQSAADLTKLLRRLRKDYEAIVAIDYFPGEAATRAEVAWQDFAAHVDTVLSPGEPHAADRAIRSLSVTDFQGRTWATRRRLRDGRRDAWERPAAASFTAVPRSLAAAVAPTIAGGLLGAGWLGAPLIACGTLKIAYDLAVLATFHRIKPDGGPS